MTTPVSSASTVAWSPASSIGTSRGHDGALGVVAAVRLDGVGVVEAVDVVGAEHDDHLGVGGPDLVPDPEQLVGVALREPVLVGGAGALLGHQQPQAALVAVEVPGPPVGDRLLDARALELQRQPHLGDPAVRQVGQREVDELVDPGERQRRLRPLPGEDVHPAPCAARLDDGQDLHCPVLPSMHSRSRSACPACGRTPRPCARATSRTATVRSPSRTSSSQGTCSACHVLGARDLAPPRRPRLLDDGRVGDGTVEVVVAVALEPVEPRARPVLAAPAGTSCAPPGRDAGPARAATSSTAAPTAAPAARGRGRRTSAPAWCR